MQEQSQYAVGIDIGTDTVKCVVGHVDSTSGLISIIGTGEAKSSGLRKGSIVNVNGPAQAIDESLNSAEHMSGYQVASASVNINGSHILSTSTDGMVAVSSVDHVVSGEDILRLEEVATMGKVPANREVLNVVPHEYRLDGQPGIRNPINMTGTRLEINANVVSAMVPQVAALNNTMDIVKVSVNNIVPSVVAAARAVLTESQMENGVAVIDLGASTTGVAIYEEGDLQYTSVIPVGGANITNDLAIGLKTDPEIAEKVKLKHGSALPQTGSETVSIKLDKETLEFSRADVYEIIDARLEELFELITKEFKKAGRYAKLPSGIVITGGGANLKDIAEYTKHNLGLAVKIGHASGIGGVTENTEKSEYAVAVGLMHMDVNTNNNFDSSKSKNNKSAKQTGKKLKKFFRRFSV